MLNARKKQRTRGIGKNVLLEDIKKFVSATTIGEKLKAKELDFLFDLFVSAIRSRVINQDRIAISGFGTFFISERKGRSLKQGGERLIEVPDYRVVRFKSSGAMKKAVNGKTMPPLLMIPDVLRIIAVPKAKTKRRKVTVAKKVEAKAAAKPKK